MEFIYGMGAVAWIALGVYGIYLAKDNHGATIWKVADLVLVGTLALAVLVIGSTETPEEYSANHIYGDTFFMSVLAFPVVAWVTLFGIGFAETIKYRIQRRRHARSRLVKFTGTRS